MVGRREGEKSVYIEVQEKKNIILYLDLVYPTTTYILREKHNPKPTPSAKDIRNQNHVWFFFIGYLVLA